MLLTKKDKKEPSFDFKESIILFRKEYVGAILLEDEEIMEIVKKRQKQESAEKENKGEPAHSSKDFLKEIKEWENFYKDNFKETIDLSKVKMPKRPKGNYRLLIIKKGLTSNQVFVRCKELFNVCKYKEDLNEAITKNSRNPKEHYAVWVQANQEPDPEYLGKPTKDADPDMKIGITLLERLIFELNYYDENKDKREDKEKHLDIKGLTFCTGSRDADGGVPGVSWSGDDSRLLVHWFHSASCYPRYGLRLAVC